MLVIRLQRTGRRNYRSFKIVVDEKKRSASGGRFVEDVGFYNPETKEKNLKGERVKYWMSVGAKPSPTVWNLLVQEKIVEGKKIPKHKKPKEKEEAAAQAEAKQEPEQKSGFNQNAKQELGQSPEQKPDFDQNTAEDPKTAPEEQPQQ